MKNLLLLASVGLVLASSKKSGGKNLSPQEYQAIHDLLIHEDIEFVKQGVFMLETFRSDDLEEFCQTLYYAIYPKSKSNMWGTSAVGFMRSKLKGAQTSVGSTFYYFDSSSEDFNLFKDFPHAQSLRLWTICELQTFPEWLKNQPPISKLYVGKFQPYRAPKEKIYIFENIVNLAPKLQEVYLQLEGDYTYFFSQASEFTALKGLFLRFLFREDPTFPDMKPGDFPVLEELTIAGSSLSGLPASFRNLQSLLLLTLQSRKLTQFPLVLLQLTNLNTLILTHCQITDVPDQIRNLKHLEELKIAHNELSKRSLPTLAKMDLDYLQITGNTQLGSFQHNYSSKQLRAALIIAGYTLQ